MGKKYFIVDDSDMIVESLRRILDKEETLICIGHTDSIETAVKTVDTLIPDIVILDYQVNGKSGLELLHHIRNQMLPIRVFIFTCYAQTEYRALCAWAGADQLFDKLSEFDRLIQHIRSFASNPIPQ